MIAAATARACPAASGSSAPQTAVRRCSCSPSPTANSQPMPGLIPWPAPSSSSAAQGHVVIVLTSVGIAEGVRRLVTAIEANLVRAQAVLELDEEARVEPHAAVGSEVHACHPSLDPV